MEADSVRSVRLQNGSDGAVSKEELDRHGIIGLVWSDFLIQGFPAYGFNSREDLHREFTTVTTQISKPRSKQMKIGVSGASGKMGQAIVRELNSRSEDNEIIAISRTPDRSTSGVETRYGDYDQPNSLVQAYAGVDRLVLIPTSDMRPGKRSDQTVTAITAAVSAGVNHVVIVSGAGARNVVEPDVGAAYWASENYLIRNAPRWTILRMNYYAESLAQEAIMAAQHGALTGFAENRVAFVARDDIAAAAAGILLGEGHAGATYTATGTKAYTGAERAALIAGITGQSLGFLVVLPEAFRLGLEQAGIPIDFVNVLTSIQHHFAAGGMDIVTGDVERLSGRPPMALRDALVAALR
ncbi:MAG: NADPH:quinone oxidoreductase 2 [Devosia sp.]|nr:NADPH:quinone oxidoreductase 2 [Devosia sp.]